MSLPNPSMAFIPFAILTADEMNDLVENDQALAAGTGFNAGAIPTAAYADNSITYSKISSATYPAFRAYLTSNQSITGSTTADLASTTEAYDNTSSLVNTTNVFTVPTGAGGIYQFTLMVSDNSGNSTRITPIIQKNGSTNYTGQQSPSSFASGTLTLELKLSAGDTMKARINANPLSATLVSGDANTWWTGRLVLPD